MKQVVIVLAAGQGKRMNAHISKQYLQLREKPILCYCLDVFEQSSIDEIVLVVGKNEIDFCKNEILDKYKYTKITNIVEGGKERYHSVMEGLRVIDACDLIYIHDGARPFVQAELLKSLEEETLNWKASIPAVPVKDTIKVVSEDGFVESTPERKSLWQVQTPQVFECTLIKEAYQKLLDEQEHQPELFSKRNITDDAMVVETYLQIPVKITPGSYDNIKITTIEDLQIADLYLEKQKTKSL